MDELGANLIAEIKRRIVKGFPEQMRVCLEVLDEQAIWARPAAGSNSVGNLLLHVCGSTRHFLGRGVGGSDYVRDRDGEFAATGPIPKALLLRGLDETVAEVARVLDGLTPARLSDKTERLDQPYTVLELLLRVSHHWAVHTGQALFATKGLKPGAFEERWKQRVA